MTHRIHEGIFDNIFNKKSMNETVFTEQKLFVLNFSICKTSNESSFSIFYYLYKTFKDVF